MTSKRRPDLKGSDAVRSAYRLLSYRDRSEKELADRLRKKGFSEDAVRSTVEYLKEKKFIDDERLARSLERLAKETKLLGSAGLRGFLRERGISNGIINEVVGACDSGEAERAERLVERKLRSMKKYSDEEIRKKLWRVLVRKGYSSDTVRQVLKRLKIYEEE